MATFWKRKAFSRSVTRDPGLILKDLTALGSFHRSMVGLERSLSSKETQVHGTSRLAEKFGPKYSTKWSLKEVYCILPQDSGSAS